MHKVNGESAFIGILTDKNQNFVYSAFGILKSSSTIVPLSPDEAIGRLSSIVQDCEIKTIIVEQKFMDIVRRIIKERNVLLKNIIIVDKPKITYQDYEFFDNEIELFSSKDINKMSSKYEEESLSTQTEQIKDSLEKEVYVVYTSGSTGAPKGVPISHSNLIPLFNWQKEEFKIDMDTRLFQNLSLSFDFGLQEMFTTLCYGGCLFFGEKDQYLQPSKFIDFLNMNKINMLYTTPTVFKEIVNHNIDLPYLELILLGGEVVSKELISKSNKILEDQCRIYNGYGPTEASINATMHLIDRKNLNKYDTYISIPIGSPTGNSEVYVLNDKLQLVPPKVVGEMYIGGVGVANGYLNKKELTNKKFLKNPYSKGYLYKTGDLVTYHNDGTIEFVERTDNQHKINGYRVEMGEIENQLLELNDISQAFVTMNIEGQIEAYIVSINREVLSYEKIMFHLKSQLPVYMLPSKIYITNKIYTNKNGKLDESQTKINSILLKKNSNNKPKNDVQLKLLRIWISILNYEDVDIDDNFFEIGGHSLVVYKLQEKIQEEFKMKFPMIKIFEYPTINLFSEYLKGNELSSPKVFYDKEFVKERNSRLKNQFYRRK